jgi:hypothetical protein
MRSRHLTPALLAAAVCALALALPAQAVPPLPLPGQPTPALAPDKLAGAPTEVPDSLALAALTQSAAAAAALQRPKPAPQWLGHGTCYVWQQPGVALVITAEWRLVQAPPEGWAGQAKLTAFLAALPHLKRERPPLRVTEAQLEQYGDESELYIEPAVYLLDAPAAADRLAMHAGGLAEWAKANAEAESIEPAPASLTPACAVVYLDGGGPLEFYFTQNADGSLSLAHLVFYEFFSA